MSPLGHPVLLTDTQTGEKYEEEEDLLTSAAARQCQVILGQTGSLTDSLLHNGTGWSMEIQAYF